jgi:hypothetical protein
MPVGGIGGDGAGHAAVAFTGFKLRFAHRRLTKRHRRSQAAFDRYAWEINTLGGADKPGGLNNAIVPERWLGIVILSNGGDVSPHEPARSVILPALAKL